MTDESLGRRAFLTAAGLLGTSVATGFPANAARGTQVEIGLPVVGSRFHMPADYRARAGDVVEIVPASFNGNRCFEVRNQAGIRLGYVPADHVPLFERASTIRACWAVDVAAGMPRRRLRVNVELVFS